jgi:hypothetical protein
MPEKEQNGRLGLLPHARTHRGKHLATEISPDLQSIGNQRISATNHMQKEMPLDAR